jgi:hypothetical protein
MLTVIMLNWARPNFALRNMHLYASYKLVKHIVCFNNGAPFVDPKDLPRKCVLVEASADLGLTSRLAAASLASTEAVFHTDDDIAVPESTVQALYQSWTKGKLSCHGLYGRTAYPTYRYGNVFGMVEVVLTRAVVCSVRVNNLALSVTDLFNDLSGKPRGNGEDIILSFAGLAASRKPNIAYPLTAMNYPACDGVAIHKRWAGHLEHRGRVVSRCREVFFGHAARRVACA